MIVQRSSLNHVIIMTYSNTIDNENELTKESSIQPGSIGILVDQHTGGRIG
jgi:hypothetical protein